MKTKIFSLLLIASAAPAFAGSATAHITCKSASGRTTVEVGDEDLTSSLAKAVITVDNKSLVYDIEANPSELYSIYDFKNKVIAMTIANKETHTQLRLWAIPSSVKVKTGNNATNGTFEAVVDGNDPREEFGFLPKISVSCKLEYSI